MCCCMLVDVGEFCCLFALLLCYKHCAVLMFIFQSLAEVYLCVVCGGI